jgi:S1-C subfamily serine protease
VQPAPRLSFPGFAIATLSLGAGFLLIGNAFSASPATGRETKDAKPSPTPLSAIENSVVKIFATVRYPDFYKPWARQAPAEFTGSGVVIDGKRILTNAHMVLYSSQVQVQAN